MAKYCTSKNEWSICDEYGHSSGKIVIHANYPSNEYKYIDTRYHPVHAVPDYLLGKIGSFRDVSEICEIIVELDKGGNHRDGIEFESEWGQGSDDDDFGIMVITIQNLNKEVVDSILAVPPHSKRTRNKTVRIKPAPWEEFDKTDTSASDDDCVMNLNLDFCDRYEEDGRMYLDILVPDQNIMLSHFEYKETRDQGITGIDVFLVDMFYHSGRRGQIDLDTEFVVSSDEDAKEIEVTIHYGRFKPYTSKTKKMVKIDNCVC